MIIYVNDYDVGIEALPTPTITLLLLLEGYLFTYLHFATVLMTSAGAECKSLFTFCELRIVVELISSVINLTFLFA